MSNKVPKPYKGIIGRIGKINYSMEEVGIKSALTLCREEFMQDIQAVSAIRYRDDKLKWSIAEISQAMSGEVGELQNFLKKKYTQGEKVKSIDIEEEFADVLKYLLVLANKCEVNLFDAYAKKWNKSLKNKPKKNE